MKSIHSYAYALRRYVLAHKIISTIVALVLVWGGWIEYQRLTSMSGQTLYVLGTVQTGTVISTVSGSGQVSPSDQVVINPKASGTITRILVKDGQQVSAGQPLAYIDSTDEYNALQSASSSLASAKLSLAKLQEPPTQLQLTQATDAVAKAQASQSTDKTNLANDYTTAYSDIVATYLDLPAIQSQLQDVIIGTEASRGTQWNIDYYQNTIENWDTTDAIAARTSAYNDYTAAETAEQKGYNDFQLVSAGSSTSTIASLLDETYQTAQDEQAALNQANALIQLYESELEDHTQTPVSEADTAVSTLSSDITKINSHVSTLLNDRNQISSHQQALVNDQAAVTEDQQSLEQLQAGPDALDVQSSQLSVQQQQNSYQQALSDLANYTITAPISGTLAGFSLQLGETVGSGTNVATLITSDDIADLSLNEVDAAKVEVGNNAMLTFDAIPGLSIAGTVTDVSPLGTVSQGVVSYEVKIGFTTQDPRVKAGMTVNADVQSAVHQNVLIVPSSAIHTQGSQTYVQAFSPPLTSSSNTGVASTEPPAQFPVTTGISDNTNTEIMTGLTEGQQIIVRTTGGNTSVTIGAPAGGGRGGGFGGGAAVRI